MRQIFKLQLIILTALFSLGGSNCGFIQKMGQNLAGDSVADSKEALTNAEAVAASKENLEIGFAGSDSTDSVTGNLDLPTTGAGGAGITWESDKPAIIAPDGTVTRPPYGSGNITVNLTATIEKGGVKETVVFVLIVQETPPTDAEAVAADKENLEIGFGGGDTATSVTQNINLPTAGSAGTTIAWQSSDPAVIGTDGTVNRPNFGEGDATVTLTAMISKGGEMEGVDFELTVRRMNIEPPDNITITSGLVPGNVTVEWDPVAGAISYNIYWSTSPGVTPENGNEISTGNPLVEITGVNIGQDVFVSVSAVGEGSESNQSPESSGHSYLLPQKTMTSGCWDDNSLISCVGTGQDGDYNVGREPNFSGPTQHSTYTSDYTTTDETMGLTWRTCKLGASGSDCTVGSPSTMDYPDASGNGTGCDQLNQANGGNGYAGITNWRLPTIEELGLLIKYDYTASWRTFDSKFPNSLSGNLWSNTVAKLQTDHHWAHYNRTGAENYVDGPGGMNNQVRCVSGPVWQNENLLFANLDGTVTDKATNLIWQKCAMGQANDENCTGLPTTGSLSNGIDYCENLSLGDSEDWRVPNINELRSIIKRTEPSGHRIDTQAFPNVSGASYQSSTLPNNYGAQVMVVTFQTGRVFERNDGASATRCVRTAP